jgi:glyoxylase-like metal-dependent hydrolase (beta-lactamase superfamily II)
MAEVKVLIEGYAKELEKGWVASSTTCLVTTEDKKIITDPGCNRESLLEALNKEGLTTDDIDFVFLSHCHPDHILLAGIFEKAKFITYDTNLMYEKDLLLEFEKHTLGKDIEIIETPGHVLEHLSLLVDTPKGKIAIAGDVIWWVEGEEQVLDINQKDHSQAKGMDMEKLVESRKKLLELADYIIPGHGKMFKVEK